MGELVEVVEVGELGSQIAFKCKVCVPALTKRGVIPTTTTVLVVVVDLTDTEHEAPEVQVVVNDRATTDRF